MFTGVTYQDWLSYGDEKVSRIRSIIEKYKSSDDFKTAVEAERYFNGDNTAIKSKTVAKATTYETKDERGIVTRSILRQDIKGNQIPNSLFFRFVTQQAQFLLANGVALDNAETKARLGIGFDRQLARMGEKALVHGVCWGYWNADHLEYIPAVDGDYNGFLALLDEISGTPMVGIQFWRIAYNKPLVVRLFEVDGVTMYAEKDNVLIEVEPKRPYIQTVLETDIGRFVMGGENYGSLPIVPLYGNDSKTSELTINIKAKIDLYDKIMSDFGDNLDRANDVYWVLNNFGGTMNDMLATVEMINRLKIVANTGIGGDGATSAEPKTMEVPYEARKTALDLLKKSLYADYMAMDMDEITGGSLTNVAIQVASANLNLKANRFEWQVFQFVQNVLKLIGVETETISFNRQTIGNMQETIQNIYTMRQDIDRETALRLNPMIAQDDIPAILGNLDAESVSGLSGVDALQKYVDESDGADDE